MKGFSSHIFHPYLCCLLLLVVGINVSMAQFSLFGEENFDTLHLHTDDDSTPPLEFPFTLFDSNFSTLYINNNGILSFQGKVWQWTELELSQIPFPAIAPFWADVDTRGSGNVYYRVSSNESDIGPIIELLDQQFPDLSDSWDIDHVLIVTWEDVGYYDIKDDKKNSFQVILIPDAQYSFVIFSYWRLEWTTGDLDGENGLGAPEAKVGIKGSGADQIAYVEGSRSPDVLTLTERSNVGKAGVWLIRVDSAEDIPDIIPSVDIPSPPNRNPEIPIRTHPVPWFPLRENPDYYNPVRFFWSSVSNATRYTLWVDKLPNQNSFVRVDLSPEQALCGPEYCTYPTQVFFEPNRWYRWAITSYKGTQRFSSSIEYFKQL